MSQTGVIGWQSQDKANEGLARQALETLCRHYPGHSWFVRIDGGALLIYNYDIDQRHCMVTHLNKMGDATTFDKKIVKGAGELLERARLRRAAATGERARDVDGIPFHKRRSPYLIQVPYKIDWAQFGLE